LQHRVGNGYVYSSAHLSDSEALDDLLSAVREKPTADPRFLRFVTGRRKLLWNRNCVALGLASGFLEPLESTSIHLVMSGTYKLLEHFPNTGFAQSNIDSYNTEVSQDIERIRDFIVLHYLTGRKDTPLWEYCQSMPLPSSLLERIELYRRCGRIRYKAGELFTDLSWFYIFDGLGIVPDSYDPLIDVVKLDQLKEILKSIAQAHAAAAQGVPTHDSYFAAGAQAR
jgi:tryptophan halogenase